MQHSIDATYASGLAERLANHTQLAIAVSGGVDSMTLATFAARRLGERVAIYHAVSPAVPEEGTRRVRELAEREGWRLHVIDANEFEDPNYRANPANRCFYCKSNLYGTIRAATRDTIASGTNLDDLGDYRPGLVAAQEHGVVHPFVEAGIAKAGVRALARELGLGGLAELPASPCLSSRVETGIAIRGPDLQAIHATERLLTERLGAVTLRCRLRAAGVVIELEEAVLRELDEAQRLQLAAEIGNIWQREAQAIRFASYRMGSAFLHARPAAGAPA